MEGELEAAPIDEIEPSAVWSFLEGKLPRVELIRPQDYLRDSVAAEELRREDHSFMRGIFHYAGTEPEEWDSIFTQTYATAMRLTRASEQLDSTLRESWAQGGELRFRLAHDSKSA